MSLWCCGLLWLLLVLFSFVFEFAYVLCCVCDVRGCCVLRVGLGCVGVCGCVWCACIVVLMLV